MTIQSILDKLEWQEGLTPTKQEPTGYARELLNEEECEFVHRLIAEHIYCRFSDKRRQDKIKRMCGIVSCVWGKGLDRFETNKITGVGVGSVRIKLIQVADMLIDTGAIVEML